VILGLMGETPEDVDTDSVGERVAQVHKDGEIRLLGTRLVQLLDDDLVLHRRATLPYHPNGMRFFAYAAGQNEPFRERTYYSVGGGFVVDEQAAGADRIKADDTVLPFPFRSGAELCEHCQQTGMPISEVMLENEKRWRSEVEIRSGLLRIWQVMQDCVQAGIGHEGILPGSLKVRRRAPEMYRTLAADPYSTDPLKVMDWVDLFALAVNEQNAAGGRVVTAPTNGAAGIIPAVLHYYRRFVPGADDDGVIRFLLTAGAIGVLYKENASISGAEVGCQGEVGSACSMAAGALCEVLGGTALQVENAAEIGMEHNLGLTCDPVGGLVQIPCIERNAMAAVKAINAARIALRGDGTHVVSLDKVIKTMRETGADMKIKYKETARGGLAVNVIEC
jgi:L-serine dehydratase